MTMLQLDAMINPSNGGIPTAQDFENQIGTQATPAILSALIPAGTLNSYVPGPRTERGFKYEWVSAGIQWRVWGHSAVTNAPVGTIAAKEWTFRVQQGNKFLTPIAFGTGQGGLGPASRWFGGQHAEKTHILLEHN
ncbi:polymorphic toxin type 30 domain-containing protein [Dyella acidisoli]|uniref:Bacterial toxin 30 domain-containing protein n=1 Tax=Dyella acidisoli TaxID=1867834 RepID=A0ABQ5XKT0_9GAMM|nr:polymorphic toxin type 30 domain-containing protein [Dyella acidisoli]GLQ91206.1 hypothetical protein GCM10007901_01560 [Dyella acidisoli]